MAGGLPPQIAAMLGAGGGGASGAPPSAPPPSAGGAPGAAPGGAGGDPAAAAKQMFMSRFLQQQGDDPKMLIDMIDQMMLKLGTLMQRTMQKMPEAYQDLLNAQKNLHTGKGKIQKAAQAHVPIQNAMAAMTQMQPSQKPPQY